MFFEQRSVGAEVVRGTEANSRRVGIDSDHVGAPTERHAEVFALSHGESTNPVVPADGTSRVVHDWARVEVAPVFLLDELRVVAGRNEAELLAFAFVRAGQIEAQCLGSHGRLVELTERKEKPRERGLAERMQEVTLVLHRVARAMELETPSSFDDARVVTGCNTRSSELIGQTQELGDFHAAIAAHAGARGRPPRDSPVNERIDHRLAKELAPIERVVRKSELVGDATRVVHVFGRAAAAANRPVVRVIPKVQRHSNDLVSLGEQTRCGHR